MPSHWDADDSRVHCVLRAWYGRPFGDDHFFLMLRRQVSSTGVDAGCRSACQRCSRSPRSSVGGWFAG